MSKAHLSPIIVKVKHAGKTYDVTVDLTAPGVDFKVLLFSLTNVEPERQKILVKGGQLKDDADMSKLGLKPGQTLMMIGTPSGNVIKAPVQKMKFLEDMTDEQLAAREGATPAGFQNLGNTCYLNSTLQTLRYIPELQQELESYKGGNSGPSPSGFALGGGANNIFGGLNLGGGSGDLTGSLRDLYKQLNGTTSGFSPVMFVNSLRAAFPQFAQKDKHGNFAQQDAEECYSQILHELKNKLKSEGAAQGFVEKYMSGKIHSTMKLKGEESPDEMPVETDENFVNLKCHITNKTNFLKDGLLEGLKEDIEKHSPSLGCEAVYEKTSEITRLPKYLTVSHSPVRRLAAYLYSVVSLRPLLLEKGYQQEGQDYAQSHLPL